MTSFSVIIAHGEDYPEEPLHDCISSINSRLEHSVYDYEIIVATEGDRCEARNKVGFSSTKNVLVFFDDSVSVHGSCIDELLRPFYEYDNVGVVGGPNVTFPNAPEEEKLVGRLWSNPLATGRSSSRYVPKGTVRETDEAEIQLCNCAILRKAFVDAGGFPPIWPNEENILFDRIQRFGYKLIYNPFAIVYHDRPKLFREYAGKMLWYGTGRGYMMAMGHTAKMITGSRTSSKDMLKLIVGWILGSFAYFCGVTKGYWEYRIKRGKVR